MTNRPALVDQRVDTKLTLMAAWASLLCLYLYCDFFALYRPGHLAEMAAGRMGPFAVAQGSLAVAGLLMIVPSLMIFASALAPARLNRWLNVAAGALYCLVNVGNLAGEAWLYYYLFGIMELGLTAFIVARALRWPRQPA